MSALRSYARRLWLSLRREATDQALRDEIDFHLSEHAARLVARGMTPEAARRAARIALGGVDGVLEATRDADRIPWIDAIAQDIRFGLRAMRRRPGFTIATLSVLAIGLGAS